MSYTGRYMYTDMFRACLVTIDGIPCQNESDDLSHFPFDLEYNLW